MAQKILLKDLFPLRTEVALVAGKPGVQIKALKLPQMVELLFKHADGFMALYAESQKPEPSYASAVISVPPFVIDIICMGGDLEEQRADVEDLPPGAQLQLLAAIWEVSVPDPKGLLEACRRLVVQVKRLAQEAAAAASQQGPHAATPSSTVSSDSTSTSQS